MDPTTAWHAVQAWPPEDRLEFAFGLWNQLVAEGWRPEPTEDLALFRRDIRAAPMSGFPYVIYYRDRGADVLIIAVQHRRRSTQAWRGRA